MKKFVEVLGTAAAGGLIVLLAAAPAFAHPQVVSRSPEDGSTIDQPPSEVEVEFDEGIDGGDIDVFDPCGAQVDNGNPEIFLQTLSVGVFADKTGTYQVQWKVLANDGHSVRGDWSFTSSGGAVCPGTGGDDGGEKNRSGGDNDPSGGGVSGTGGTTDDGGSGSTTATGAGNGGKDGGTDDRDKAGHKGHGKGGKDHKNHKNHKTAKDDPKEIDLIAGDDGSKSSDLPLDWLVISFGIAALIGAAAGLIYVSLTPPG